MTHAEPRERASSALIAAMAIAAVAGALAACTPEPPEARPSASGDWSMPPAPLLEAQVTCIQDAGFEVKVDFTGQISGPEMPSEQAQLWKEAADKCGQETNFYAPQLSTSQIDELYRQEVATHECLIAADYSSAPPPSAQTYRDTWGGGKQYYAFFEIWMAGTAPDDLKKIVERCTPPTWFLNLKGLG